MIRPTFHRCELPPSWSLMMEAVRTSETSVDKYFSRPYIPEDNSEHHTRRRENLKSDLVNLYEEATLRCIRRFESLRIKKAKRLCSAMPRPRSHPWWWRQYAPLKRRSTIILHGSTSQKTILNFSSSVGLSAYASCCLASQDDGYDEDWQATVTDSWRDDCSSLVSTSDCKLESAVHNLSLVTAGFGMSQSLLAGSWFLRTLLQRLAACPAPIRLSCYFYSGLFHE
jgi:hypothetical protein